MRGYRFTFLDRNGQVRADITLRSPSDEAAFEIAEDMLRVSGYTTLELRSGSKLISCMRRIAGDESPRRSRFLRLVPDGGHPRDFARGRC